MGDPNSYTHSIGSYFGNPNYIVMPTSAPQPMWSYTPAIYPPNFTMQHVGHILANPTTPMHCPFCGSGEIFGRSDGVIECEFCHRGCVIMEQPLYSAMPGAPGGGAKPAAETPPPEAPEADPSELAAAPAFEPPETPEAPEDGQAGDDANTTDKVPEQFKTSKGAQLKEGDYVRHLAFRHAREAMLAKDH